MAHAQKSDFVFRRNGRVHLNRQGRQFSRLLTAEVWASAVVMLNTPCSEVVWRVLATHSIRQFPLHFPPVRHRVLSHFKCSLPKPINMKKAIGHQNRRVPNGRGRGCWVIAELQSSGNWNLKQRLDIVDRMTPNVLAEVIHWICLMSSTLEFWKMKRKA